MVTPSGEARAGGPCGTIRDMSATTRFASPTGRPLGRTVVLLVVGVAVLTAAVVGIGWLITHPFRHGLTGENDVNRWFADQRSASLTDVADGGTLVGETITGLVALALIGVVFAVWKRSWWPLAFVGALDAGLGLFYLAGTSLDPRQRPPVPILQSGLVPDASFPSGHTGTATAIGGSLAALLWAYTRVAGWALVALVVVPAYTMVARLYIGAHHVTDVVTAFVAAALWLLVCTRLLLPQRETTSVAEVSEARSAAA
jgi:membrane-associated phospholipid phosphatase